MSDPTTQRVREFLRRPGITQQLLADASKVHRNTIARIEGGAEPSARVREALVGAVERLEAVLA